MKRLALLDFRVVRGLVPRYYFHIHDYVFTPDEEGKELADLGAARHYALEAARDLVCENIGAHGGVNLDHYLDVTNADGQTLFELTFRDAFRIEG